MGQSHHCGVELQPLPGVGAAERFVEDQDLGIVDQSRRQPHPLAHAPGVGPEAPVLGIGTSASISSRPEGSRPAVGSSSRTKAGSWTKAWPSFTRCFMPVEYCPMGR